MLRRVLAHLPKPKMPSVQARMIGARQYAPSGLREAAARLPMTKEFAEECYSLAKTAHQTKNFGDAISLYDRALMVRRETQGPITVACADVLFDIGRVFIDMREFGAAENALTEAAAIYEEKFTVNSEPYARSLSLLAHCYCHLKFLDESEKAFKESLSIFKGLHYNHDDNCWVPRGDPPTSDPNCHPLSSVAHCLADCASLFVSRGWEHRATTFLEEALEIRRFLYSRHPKFKPMIAQTLNKLAEMKRAAQDAFAAEAYINECLDICVETMGRDSPATASALSSKGNLLAAKKKFREAQQCFQEAATTYALTFGKESAIVGTELIRLARVEDLASDLRVADKTYRRGIEIITKTMPESLPLAEAKTYYGLFLMKRLDFDNAIPLYRDSIQIRRRIDANDSALAMLYQKLGESLSAKKDTTAESYFLQSIEQYTKNAEKEPTQRTLMTDAYDDLGHFYMSFKHYDKAESVFKTSLDLRIEMLGETHPTVGYSYSNYAVLYLERQQYEDCLRMCELSMDVYSRTNRQNELAHADVFTTRGQCYEAMRRYDEALNWLHKALDIRRIRGESTDTATAESLHQIGRVLVKKKEYASATKTLQEARRLCAIYGDLLAELKQQVIATEESIPDPSTW